MRRKLDKKNGPIAAAVTLAAALSANAADAATTDLFTAADTTCGAALSALTTNSFEPGGSFTALGVHDAQLGGGFSIVSTEPDLRYDSGSGVTYSGATNMTSILASEVSESGISAPFRGTANTVAYDYNTDILLVGDARAGGVFVFDGFETELSGGSDMSVSFIQGNTTDGVLGNTGVAVDGFTGDMYGIAQRGSSAYIDLHDITSGSVGSPITSLHDLTGVGVYDGAFVISSAGSGIMQMANASATPAALLDASGAQPSGDVLAVYGPNQLPLGSSLTPGYYTVYRDSSTNEVRYCFAPAATTPLPPELSAVDVTHDMSLGTGVTVPQDINLPIELTAICDDPDSPASDLSIAIEGNWESGSAVYMNSTGRTTPASGTSGSTVQEGFEYTAEQEGRINVQAACEDADGGQDSITGVTYEITAPTASGALTEGYRYAYEGDSLIHVETPGASASAGEVTVEGSSEGDRISMAGLADALAYFTYEGATVEITSYSDSSVEAYIVTGISAGATGSPEGAPPPNADTAVSLRVNVVEGTAYVVFTDAEGTVIYEGEVTGSLDANTTEVGGSTGGDDGGGETGNDDGGSGSGVEGGETDGGDDGGADVEGGGSGGSERGGCSTVSSETPAAILAMLPLVLAAARRRQS